MLYGLPYPTLVCLHAQTFLPSRLPFIDLPFTPDHNHHSTDKEVLHHPGSARTRRVRKGSTPLRLAVKEYVRHD